jgi:hypothetical protein
LELLVVTIVTNTNLNKGNSITISGATEGVEWVYTILACDSLTAFDIIISATATLIPSLSQSTTLIVDSSKNWVVDEHIGKIIIRYCWSLTIHNSEEL